MDEHGNLDGPIGSPTSRLVVLRGNSGSGKSTVAAGLRAERPERSLAVVGQDLVRRDLLGVYDDRDGHATQLIDLTTRYALTRGFDVVLEGILNPRGTATPCSGSSRITAASPAATSTTCPSRRRSTVTPASRSPRPSASTSFVSGGEASSPSTDSGST